MLAVIQPTRRGATIHVRPAGMTILLGLPVVEVPEVQGVASGRAAKMVTADPDAAACLSEGCSRRWSARCGSTSESACSRPSIGQTRALGPFRWTY